MTVEECRLLLCNRNLALVARETGIKYMTIRNFALGLVANPRADSFVKIVNYLKNH